MNQSLSEVMQNQSNSLITFDTQLKTALNTSKTNWVIQWIAIYPVDSAIHPSNNRALGPVVEKPINANPRLKINQGGYFSTPKCCFTLIFDKPLH